MNNKPIFRTIFDLFVLSILFFCLAISINSCDRRTERKPQIQHDSLIDSPIERPDADDSLQTV